MKHIVVFGLPAALLLALALLSLGLGTVAVPFDSMVRGLIEPGSPSYFIVHEVRLPRVCTGILAGMGLAVSGVFLQGVIRNPLASPDVIGITKGAGAAAAAVIFLFPKAPGVVLPVAAFAGGLLSFLLLTLLTRRLSLPPASLALVGVAMGAVFQAIIQYLIVLHPADINMALLWLAGSLWGRGWREAASLLPWIAVLLPVAWAGFARLNVLQLGDDIAASLGLRVIRERFWLLLLAVMLAAIAVSAVGAIGFIGLIAPHLARALTGGRYQRIIPLAALIGADLMLLGDLLGRTLISPREIPVGIMAALLGAPYFIYLLRRDRVRRK